MDRDSITQRHMAAYPAEFKLFTRIIISLQTCCGQWLSVTVQGRPETTSSRSISRIIFLPRNMSTDYYYYLSSHKDIQGYRFYVNLRWTYLPQAEWSRLISRTSLPTCITRSLQWSPWQAATPSTPNGRKGGHIRLSWVNKVDRRAVVPGGWDCSDEEGTLDQIDESTETTMT